MNKKAKCKHGQLARSCEICELQTALDRVIEERDELWFDARDRYAQAALTGILACPDSAGDFDELVDEAFTYANAAMVRRLKR